MATPSPNDFQMNNRSKDPPTLGQFIRMKRVPRKKRKPSLGIKNLITKFENKLTTGEQVQGSVLAAPSAPSCPEDDSDCESWGSDFDDDENAEDLPWEPQEEMENSINDMLEAAMERNRKLQSSQLGGSVVPELPSRSDAHLPPERLGFSEDPNAPPLPPRNPAGISSASPMNRSQENRTSAGNSTAGRGISETNVKPPSMNTSKPATAQTKSPTQGVTPPVSRFAAQPIPSTSGTGNTPRQTPVGSSTSESSRHATPQGATSTFPPDVTNISSNSPTFSRLPLASSVITAAGSTSVPGDEASRSSKREVSNVTNASQAGNPQKIKLLQEVAEVPGQPKGSVSVPPPLPSRPPPVRRLLNNPPLKNSATHIASPASASEVKNDAAVDQKITQQAVNRHTVPQLPNPVAKLQITKGASSSLTNLAEPALHNSSSSESSKPISSSSEPLSSHLVVRLPEKPDPKRRSVAFGVPKIIRELDVAVLKQVIPKKTKKSASFGEMEHRYSPADNSTKAEDANCLSDEYLNPKEVSAAGPRFEPERPTLPRRLKHAKSLPLLNLVDTLKKDSSKKQITAVEQSHVKLCLQPSQATNETSEKGPEFMAVNDEVFRQPWYHPVTWAQAQFKLTTMAQDGAFLVRPSSRILDGVPFTISIFFRGRVINCYISSTPERKYALGTLKPNQKTFDTITELIRYYQSTPAELRIGEAEPVSKVCLLITPPRDSDKIYADV